MTFEIKNGIARDKANAINTIKKPFINLLIRFIAVLLAETADDLTIFYQIIVRPVFLFQLIVAIAVHLI